MPFNIIREDITRLNVDAIVNAANEHLKQGGGVCGAIFAAAGADDLQRACDAIGHVDTGSAVITPGFALPARHVIHTAGPIWHGTAHDRELLASCYRSSLELARENGLASIAFPLISSGVYGCPKDVAMDIAVSSIRDFLADDDTDMEVTLVLFGHREALLGEELFGRLTSFIDDAYVDESRMSYGRRLSEEPWLADIPSYDADMFGSAPAAAPSMPPAHAPLPASGSAARVAAPAAQSAPAPKTMRREKRSLKDRLLEAVGLSREAGRSLTDMLENMDASFTDTLLALIDERGLTDAEVYKRANLSRQYFSRLRAGTINPSKRVVLALAVALHLDLAQTRLLLERSGYALSRSYKLDVIVEFFIDEGIYDIFTINQALFACDQQLLGT